jgi:uncharacterized protein (DUF736 family)
MADQARGAAKASIAFPQRLRLLLSPAAKAQHSSREVKKAGSRGPPLTLRAQGLRADRSPGQGSPSRPRWARPEQQTETSMATIGSFTASDNGFIGSIKTLTLNIKTKFAPSDKENDKAPDYRIFAGATEFGAAWKKTARDSDREYLSVKLDDPSFPAPIYASLVKVDGDEGYILIWSRRSGD